MQIQTSPWQPVSQIWKGIREKENYNKQKQPGRDPDGREATDPPEFFSHGEEILNMQEVNCIRKSSEVLVRSHTHTHTHTHTSVLCVCTSVMDTDLDDRYKKDITAEELKKDTNQKNVKCSTCFILINIHLFDFHPSVLSLYNST